MMDTATDATKSPRTTMKILRSLTQLRSLVRGEALLAAVVFLPSGLAARFDDPKPKQDSPVPLPALGGNPNDPHAEMRKLFGKIERDLRQIDQLLADASANPGARAGAGASSKDAAAAGKDAATATSKDAGTAASKSASAIEGLDKLLASSEERGKSVLESIDRILELAQHDPSSSSSSCESAGGMCKSSGSSKSDSKNRSGSGKEPGKDEKGGGRSLLDRQGGTTTQREATPEGPESSDQQGQKDSKSGSKDAAHDSASKNGPKPSGNQSSKSPAENAAGDPNGDAKSRDARGANGDADKWGDLPVHVRDVFRTQGGGDMPAQYRDWIDAYYRRMAKKAGS
jgi:hypothetical protein